eukprot:CAMPEP_0197033974 /NCGR_PEP_ID=MMETSP1384-20130603/12223_1 /TAXON_ID=29189 /ORGANISM="Ammonia sp." /LENGTH=116 /DNA_ID=CAMNT_0042463841 /DNA_START=282 /DNA_END=632 /DNA_ORIENTATION=+
MDWVGIKRAERLMQIILILCALGSVAYAYINEYFPYTTYGMIGGFFVSCLITVPDWPWFNMDPVGWHKAIDPEKEAKYFEKIQKKKGKKDKDKDTDKEHKKDKASKKNKASRKKDS